MTGRLIVISGPSGVGKTSIVRALLERLDLEFSVSATTRQPRPGEVDGKHFHFVLPDEFERLICDGALLEWASYNGNYYGTPVEPITVANDAGQDVLLEIEIQGARQIRAHRPDSLMFFVAPPSMAVLERRLRGRGDTSDEDIAGRLDVAQNEMDEAPDLFDHLVVNDTLERAIDEIANLIIDTR